jgi:hypothetical protein
MVKPMLKGNKPPKEKAHSKASRKWRNHEMRKKLIEERQKPKLVDPNQEPEIAEIVTNEARLKGPIRRFENRFKKEIRAMLQSHVDKNLAIYAISLDRRKRILLTEKLKRLKLAQQANGGSNV